ncbi:hypothetical protein X767_04820 [Mesorhizobium sp. LSJC264A00]|nr:hypothetical protein X767_04820 [Mesorhizobium sp. LSJC264A00]
MTVECFFADAHERLKCTNEEREQRLEERLTLAKEMTGSVDPLDFIETWISPGQRHHPKFGGDPPSAGGAESDS